MRTSSVLDRVLQHEGLNFALTNRIPRRLATRFMGWFSRIEQPLIRDVSIAVWQLFAGDLNLAEARKSHFTSLHDCFIRELRVGARPIDRAPGVIVSPCDGIMGAFGALEDTSLIQAKGFPYTLEDLLSDSRLVEQLRGGSYVTLRLTSAMYHRFHAPYDSSIDDEVTYVPGETWNVNPAALRRIDRLYCQNERAIVPLRLVGSDQLLVLVPVAAILVAGIQFEFVDVPLDMAYRGPSRIPCRASFARGQEIGHFRHGSTILVFGTRGLAPCAALCEGQIVRVGQPLMQFCEP